MEHIYDVIGKMAVTEQRYAENGDDAFLPFIHVYKLVTTRVAYAAEHTDTFRDTAALASLDRAFADLYYDPVDAYFESGEKQDPWKPYLDATEENHHPLTYVLLGINTHINADLLHALYIESYEEQRDYKAVNDILKDLTPGVMHYLGSERHDYYGKLAELFPSIVLREVDKIIVHWRRTVWKAYQAYKDKGFSKIQRPVYAATESIAEQIISTFSDGPQNLLSAVKKLEKQNVYSSLHELYDFRRDHT